MQTEKTERPQNMWCGAAEAARSSRRAVGVGVGASRGWRTLLFMESWNTDGRLTSWYSSYALQTEPSCLWRRGPFPNDCLLGSFVFLPKRTLFWPVQYSSLYACNLTQTLNPTPILPYSACSRGCTQWTTILRLTPGAVFLPLSPDWSGFPAMQHLPRAGLHILRTL